MIAARATLMLVTVATVGGCRSTPVVIFPEISPPIVWPKPPDRPRIRYVGELRGEASLGAKPSGWDALRAAIAGPRPLGIFSRPAAVAVAGERVFVADTGLALVHVLDLANRRYLVISGSPTDPLRVPIDLTIADGDQLVVVDRGRAAIDVFDLDGTWRATKRWPELSAPVAATWDQTRQVLWLLDVAAHACFACEGLQQLGQRMGERGGAPGQFNFPAAVTAHPTVGLVVADAMNFRVQVFDGAGRPTVVFGQKGDAAGDFARPRDVAVDSEGHIYVLDNQFENVQIFDRDGHLLMALGQAGQGPGQFSLPSGITIDDQDRIWIADSQNRRVQVFQYLPEDASW
ncbi:MAG TPA: 6-bladed beta-propeller [Phycisphaerae bacterium]|nr:6-bladed beta-propeller [Phycisphaerae bacterium]